MLSVKDEKAMKVLGHRLGSACRGGEVFELVGDVGAGKTTLAKGLGKGLNADDDVQSPSFTISRVYKCRDGLELHHYDLYRLQDAGVMKYELLESLADKTVVTVIEWAETVSDVLPDERVRMEISYHPADEGRDVTVILPKKFDYLQPESAA